MKPERIGGSSYWAVPLEFLLASLQATAQGLSSDQVRERLTQHGPNTLAKASGSGAGLLLVRQFSSPIILILAGAACLSFLLDSPTDGVIILLNVLISGLLGFVPLPPFFLLWLLLILVAYVASAELVKGWFYRNEQRRS